MLRLQQERRLAVQVLDRRSTGISETRDGIPPVLAYPSCEPGGRGRAVKRPPKESEGQPQRRLELPVQRRLGIRTCDLTEVRCVDVENRRSRLRMIEHVGGIQAELQRFAFR